MCDRVLYDTFICPQCNRKIKYIKQPACFLCGKPLTDENQEYCTDCMRTKHEFAQGKAVFCYQGQMQQMLYRFKYSNRRDYADFFAAQASRLYGDWIKRCCPDMVVPIPLAAKRRRKRGYNQAEVFAKQLAQECGLPYSNKILVRVRNTIPQKQLSAAQRKNNMKNAFKIEQNIVKLDRVLLVDDIYTTGSTIDAAALALKQAGVKKVYYLCISIGQGQ